MPRFQLSSESIELSEAEQFSFWRDAICEPLYGVTLERDEATPRWNIDVRIASAAKCARTRARCGPAQRLPRNVAKVGFEDQIWILKERSPGAWFDHGRTELVLRAGDLVIMDPTITFVSGAPDGFWHDHWALPRALVEPHLPAGRAPRLQLFPAGGGMNQILTAYLDAFADRLDTLPANEAAALVDNLCRLVAVTCGSASAEHGTALCAARLEEAKRHIAHHLADPELSPESVATALDISRRQLHTLFEPTGTTFAQYVLALRLAECRTALAQGNRRATDVALAWGFNSLATFYRNFRRAYGMAPGDVRPAERK